jgi:hypothetical protein
LLALRQSLAWATGVLRFCLWAWGTDPVKKLVY